MADLGLFIPQALILKAWAHLLPVSTPQALIVKVCAAFSCLSLNTENMIHSTIKYKYIQYYSTTVLFYSAVLL